MQENEEKFAQITGGIIKELRQNNPKKYVMFCDESGLPNSTLNNIENGLRSAKLYTVAKIIKALGLNFKDFGEILDDKVPQNLLVDDDKLF